MKYKLIINLKTYRQGFNKKAIEIARIVNQLKPIADKNNVEIILCPQMIDIKDILRENVNCYAQHIDNSEMGAFTGKISTESIKKIGCMGTLISHSEDIETIKNIENKIQIAKQHNLKTCVCARNDKAVKKIVKLNPDFIAVEPKKLIGGDISVSTADPELIERSIKITKEIPLLVGAGIKNKQDVKIAVELGAKGVLVASGVVKSINPKKTIQELIEGFSTR